MIDQEANRGDSTGNPQRQFYYGTFQGVANYYPPPPPPHPLPQPVVGFPQPVAPNPSFTGHGYQNSQGFGPSDGNVNYSPGYQTVPGYAIVDIGPMREHSLPCCGMGMGWFLFIVGFFFGGIPWYLGAFILLCVPVDHREKPGYAACAIASILCMIAFMLGVTKGAHTW